MGARLLLLFALVLPASTPQSTVPEIAADPVMQAEQVEQGRLLYGIYCRNCHGETGHGDGEEARSLDPPPPDLTRLTRDNDGEFPTARVMMVIDGRQQVPGHLNRRMPVWGISLQQAGSDANQEGDVREKIERLVVYLESIQKR